MINRQLTLSLFSTPGLAAIRGAFTNNAGDWRHMEGGVRLVLEEPVAESASWKGSLRINNHSSDSC